MDVIVSKRHPINFYLLNIIILVVGNLVGYYIITLTISERSKPNFPSKYDFLLVLGFTVIIYSFYAIYRYVKNAPSIRLEENSLSFNNTIYSKENIDYIEISGKHKFGILLLPSEGMKIIFKDATTKYIFDSLYSNSATLKQCIKHIYDNSETTFSPLKIEPVIPSPYQHYYPYKGNFFLSFRGLLTLSLLMIPILVPKHPNSPELWKLLLPIMLITIILSDQFYYFRINDRYFNISNHLKFWKKKTYRIIDIIEVAFESNGRAPHSLKIIMKDYRTKSYFAATLSDKTWKELQIELEKHNIKVRNEIS